MTTPLSAFGGNVIYFDTMLPYALLRSIDPAVKLFFDRIERGVLLAYTSVLTFDELAYRLLLALIKDHYGGSPLDHLREEEEKNRLLSLRPGLSLNCVTYAFPLT